MMTVRSVLSGWRRYCMQFEGDSIRARHAYNQYELTLDDLLRRSSAIRVLDIGGGRGSTYGDRYPASGVELTVVDIDEAELGLNTIANSTVVADICGECSHLDNARYDLVTVRAGVEHFPDNRAAVENMFRVLAPGGVLVATFANRWAPFAIINQVLPQKAAAFLLENLTDGAKEVLGFEAHYDNCSHRAFLRLLEDSGFKLSKYYSSFDSSNYFAALPPIYAMSRVLDAARSRLARPDLASYHLFVATKPPMHGVLPEPN